MKLVAFAASSSSTSINKRLVTYAASLIPDADTTILDLNDFHLPVFSVDMEKEIGHPDVARWFLREIANADALLISFAEHNGSYTTAWKNLFDWCSRIETKVYQNKPIVMLATSPGKRGAIGVLQTATNSAPHFGGDLKASLSIPSFNENFDIEQGRLSNAELQDQLETALKSLST